MPEIWDKGVSILVGGNGVRAIVLFLASIVDALDKVVWHGPRARSVNHTQQDPHGTAKGLKEAKCMPPGDRKCRN